MPGFLGGSTGGTGTGGEISFPKEFIDPVTKLRISQPENLIDTDFEYGLQPTKWETVELINNTPSFFSKSGDTTIPGIVSITTNDGTREITVTTALDHGLAVGIPINVTGTKSITADGSYIINSIPNSTTFTYLCKDNQVGNNSIEDLYSSIITGEFFQGSQLRISDAEGITTDGEPVSTLTVRTDSTHGFGVNTPFYFLNLNSTISQEFEAANTAAKSFDSSNSATAQTFDGSNTLSTFNIDWSNSATDTQQTSPIAANGISTANNTITVNHSNNENFSGQKIGTPLYYDVVTSAGYFASNPRGVVFLKTNTQLGTTTSTFQVSETPDGDPIALLASMTGFFQLATRARTFAGNNVDSTTEISLSIIRDAALPFEGANDGGPQTTPGVYDNGNPLCTVASYSGSLINVTVTAGAGLAYYTGAMVRYTTTGAAASGLTNNRTYFIDSFFSTGANAFAFTIKELPTGTALTSISGGSGTQTFTRIGVSTDKDVVHIKDSSYTKGDLLEYTFPENGNFVSDSNKRFFFVETVYDSHNYQLTDSLFTPTVATGGTLSTQSINGRTYNVHTFTTEGLQDFIVTQVGTEPFIEVVAYGAGGGGGSAGGWGFGANAAGGGYAFGRVALSTAKTYKVMVGGRGNPANGDGGGNTMTFEPAGGGGRSKNPDFGDNRYGGQGAGLSGIFDNNTYNVANAILIAGGGGGGGSSRAGEGNVGGAGGGTTGQDGVAPYDGLTARRGRGGRQDGTDLPTDGNRINPAQLQGGTAFNYGGGGGGGWWGGSAGTYQESNTMGGGGGGSGYAHPTKVTNAVLVQGDRRQPPAREYRTTQGVGGSVASQGTPGLVVVRYPITPYQPIAPVATGGTITTTTSGGVTYRIHSFTTVGTTNFVVTEPGNFGPFEYLVVAGGGSGGSYVGGGGGAGGVIAGTFTPTAQSYSITVGGGGPAAGSLSQSLVVYGNNGGNSTAFGQTAIGGGGGGVYAEGAGRSGGSGGGAGGFQNGTGGGGAGTAGQGNNGGNTQGGRPRSFTGGGGGGGAGGGGETSSNGLNRGGDGGIGIVSAITGTSLYWGGGGGGGNYTDGARPGNGGLGGGGGGSSNTANVAGIGGGSALNSGGNGSPNGDPNNNGGAGGANTGGGGGGIGHHGLSGPGGTGIVIVRYPIDIAQ